MTTTVSVFGLGYVGCVSAACLANEGFDIIGVDVNVAKVTLVASGHPTVVEEGIEPLMCSMVQAGRLHATMHAAEAVRHSSISLICVGTPSQANGSLNLSHVQRVAERRALGDAQAEPAVKAIAPQVVLAEDVADMLKGDATPPTAPSVRR